MPITMMRATVNPTLVLHVFVLDAVFVEMVRPFPSGSTYCIPVINQAGYTWCIGFSICEEYGLDGTWKRTMRFALSLRAEHTCNKP